MTKIIQFKKPKEHKDDDTNLVATNVTLPMDITKILKEAGIETPSVYEIMMFLKSLKGQFSNDSVIFARQIFKKMSLERLEHIARNSNKTQWQKRPGYFSALVDEILFRHSGPPGTNKTGIDIVKSEEL